MRRKHLRPKLVQARNTMSTLGGMLLAAVVALGLAACGGGGTSASSPTPPEDPSPTGSTSTQRGTLVSASLTISLSTSQFTANLNSIDNGPLVLQWGGPLSCAINIYRIKYWTVAPTPTGGASSPTLVSGALMIPTGPGPQCSGARPLLLFAHGLSNPDPTYTMTDVSDLTKGVEPAAIFATQGYIVVAPNFPGYDGSTLGYYPLLNADQNAKDMMDALTAATAALSGGLSSTTTYNGKLFVTGGSLGGFVAMATDKAMQAAGLTVVATAPTSATHLSMPHTSRPNCRNRRMVCFQRPCSTLLLQLPAMRNSTRCSSRLRTRRGRRASATRISSPTATGRAMSRMLPPVRTARHLSRCPACRSRVRHRARCVRTCS